MALGDKDLAAKIVEKKKAMALGVEEKDAKLAKRRAERD
jgi:hypothetical protein